MAYNFNNPYPFGWSAANPFIPPVATPAPPPGFNLTPALSDQQHLTGGSVTPVFNSNVLLPPNITFSGSNLFPYGLSAQAYPSHSPVTSSNFPASNWNYRFQSPPVQSPPAQAQLQNNSITSAAASNSYTHGSSIECSSVQQPSDKMSSLQDSKSKDKSNSTTDEISDEFALKVLSWLSNPSALKNAISKLQSESPQKDNNDNTKNDKDLHETALDISEDNNNSSKSDDGDTSIENDDETLPDEGGKFKKG